MRRCALVPASCIHDEDEGNFFFPADRQHVNGVITVRLKVGMPGPLLSLCVPRIPSGRNLFVRFPAPPTVASVLSLPVCVFQGRGVLFLSFSSLEKKHRSQKKYFRKAARRRKIEKRSMIVSQGQPSPADYHEHQETPSQTYLAGQLFWVKGRRDKLESQGYAYPLHRSIISSSSSSKNFPGQVGVTRTMGGGIRSLCDRRKTGTWDSPVG